MKLLLAHVNAPPAPPSSRTEIPIPPDLDALMLSCLAKDRKHRPKWARDLLQRLDTVVLQQRWTDTRAREWWNVHLPQQSADAILALLVARVESHYTPQGLIRYWGCRHSTATQPTPLWDARPVRTIAADPALPTAG